MAGGVGAQDGGALLGSGVAEDLFEAGKPDEAAHGNAGHGCGGGDQAADEPVVHGDLQGWGLLGPAKLSGQVSGHVLGRVADTGPDRAGLARVPGC